MGDREDREDGEINNGRAAIWVGVAEILGKQPIG